ncbi:MAG: Hpt domain-containing protein, partial [Pyrinomonadaceae bacterium MAG19_C2-C3]|nr:Hpt domain-containing protein [Pyrinomonadaceae bacterium MAG19_C2-C3]
LISAPAGGRTPASKQVNDFCKRSDDSAAAAPVNLENEAGHATASYDFVFDDFDPKMLDSYRAFGQADEPDFVSEIIDLFIATTLPHLTEMRLALEQSDHALLEHHAHALRGGSASIGLRGVAEAAKRLEHFAQSKDLDSARPLFIALAKAWAGIEATLKSERSQCLPDVDVLPRVESIARPTA